MPNWLIIKIHLNTIGSFPEPPLWEVTDIFLLLNCGAIKKSVQINVKISE